MLQLSSVEISATTPTVLSQGFVVLLSSSRQMLLLYLKLANYRFFPYPIISVIVL